MTRQNCAVTSSKRETCRAITAKFVIEIGKHLRHDSNHDDAVEFAVASWAPTADTEERFFPHARLQYLADESAHVPIHLREEVVAVGHAGAARDREDRRGHKRVPVFVDNQNAINGVERLFKLAQLEMDRLRGGLDLVVGEISDDGVDTGECQVNRLKDFGGLFGEDVQGRRKLFVSASKGVLVIKPARIDKKCGGKKD